jgi:lauroyl/myristoyl acyltransferase
MGDRDIEGPKKAMTFFGVQTLMPTGPIEVGLRTGAAVIPCFCARKSKFVIEAWVEKPLEMAQTGDFQADVRAAMTEYIGRLQTRLRADPSQWAVIEAIWDGEAEVGREGGDVSEEKSEVGVGERGDG